MLPGSADGGLRVASLVAGYDSQTVIRGASLVVERGRIVSLMGPNGAGKSTLLKAIAGIVRCKAGKVILEDLDVTNLRSERLAQMGLGYVPQLEDVFAPLTVQENLDMGGYLLDRDSLRDRIQAVFDEFPRLADLRRRRASTLSGGERKLLAIARALMVEHRFLLLDEPTAGLSPSAAAMILTEVVRKVAEKGVGIILVEQRARAALEVSDWGYIMVNGEIRVSKPAASLLARSDLAELLIGKTDANGSGGADQPGGGER